MRCAAADQTSVWLLRAELDEGEAEALIQAAEKAARFFIGDEKRAREISEGMGLKPVGTLRILARLSAEDLAPELGILVRKLQRDLGFRVSKEVIRQAIATEAEPI
jgi:predicted nucleic acid-binding protein